MSILVVWNDDPAWLHAWYVETFYDKVKGKPELTFACYSGAKVTFELNPYYSGYNLTKDWFNVWVNRFTFSTTTI